ncbi:glutamine-hydrolyzing carbamoyl-phosphate synthase small subunit [Ilumatobacter sp.]|uniref:glutamine-hydrolyzing carbamoyl-phosphate synthase small subunit n=1 Tax=Ilumatobacter sp. TaxID=1967498 RepID=UPI003B52B8C6
MSDPTTRPPGPATVEGHLVLADGSVFEGDLIGAHVPVAAGEVVFNTCQSGYQEVITDPSYAGQIITFTTPHVGNYGINSTDFESVGTFCRGIVVRDLARRHSNHRAQGDLGSMLHERGVPGIAGIDTRRLTRTLRDHGSIPGAFGSAATDELRAVAEAEPGTEGIDLVRTVTTPVGYSVAALDPDSRRRIVAIDYGMKRNIARHLSGLGHVDVVPASTTAADVLARDPDGVFLSNGPGDPGMYPDAVDAIRDLIGEVPVFGICLGHQLLGRAIGADTVKLAFGHHGGNHPVKNLATDRIEITSQNHNFAVDADSLPSGARMTHVNLNDGVCEGLELIDELAFGVQHHPEANPGPHDAGYLFARFETSMELGEARRPAGRGTITLDTEIPATDGGPGGAGRASDQADDHADDARTGGRS